ncbi:MAG: glycoside hydrolase family 2 protein, partial [Ferruginibacter sp.]|nr:glycoside hydrolase family 2 protein [Rhodoferax sp.]
MRLVQKINDGWIFHVDFSQDLIANSKTGETVRLPHNAVDLEMNYFDEKSFQKEFAYQLNLPWQPAFQHQEVALVFDGSMANTVVWVNGKQVAQHADGYTPFEARLTGLLNPGDNLVTVKIDGSENPDIPPFGGQIDYLTYAGIYRDVWLKVTDAVSIARIKVETAHELSDAKTVTVIGTLANPRGVVLAGSVRAELCTLDGTLLQQQTATFTGDTVRLVFSDLAGLALWEMDSPQLYRVVLHTDTS